MPPIVAALIWIEEVLVFGGLNALLLGSALSLGFSVVLGEIAKLFAKGPSASSLTNQIASRTIVSR